MDKFLFSDGTNAIKEVYSAKELQDLLDQAEHKEVARIWKFNSSEWISYADFVKEFPSFLPKRQDKLLTNGTFIPETAIVVRTTPRKRKIGRFILYLLLAGVIVLVFNFTRLGKETTSQVTISAQRPGNVPVMDMDSLIRDIEDKRGQKIDRSTKNNLRLRNTWPERIILQATASKETNKNGNRFSAINILLDNTTGYKIDKTVVKLIVWRNNKETTGDTIQFTDIPYTGMIKKDLDGTYRGDSISVVFDEIKAGAFNFCYSSEVENKSGNYNDRWFCRE
ncbi:MAG TPA: hypothetical protein PKC72_10260 [Chitinophagaceae bacterium]|nr:hypothetical protein [Chitinophagaceae bacterium]